MYSMGFIEIFMEIFNANAAIAMIFFCGHVLFKTFTVDKDLLKAKLFLNNAVMQQIWIYISIAGASFALNTLIRLADRILSIGDIFRDYYLVELTQVIFVIAFIHAAYSWYLFISMPTNPLSRRG